MCSSPVSAASEHGLVRKAGGLRKDSRAQAWPVVDGDGGRLGECELSHAALCRGATECWVPPCLTFLLQLVQAFTHAPAMLEADKGGKFHMVDGNVSGEFTELVSAAGCRVGPIRGMASLGSVGNGRLSSLANKTVLFVFQKMQ